MSSDDESRDVTHLSAKRSRSNHVAAVAEKQNVLEEHLYRALFENMPQGMICLDGDGQIILANAVAQQTFGLTLDQLRDRAALLFARDEEGRPLREEFRPMYRILSGEVLKERTAVGVLVHRSDGLERYLSVSGAPLRDHNRQVMGAVVMLQDVTEQREHERQLQRSLDALLAMAEAMVQENQDVDMLVESESAEVSGAPSDIEQPPPIESITGRRLLELPCRLLNCQRVAIALVDPQTEILRPMVIVGISPEHEQHWHNSLQGVRLSSLLGDPDLVARLYAGEMLSLDATVPFFRDQSSYKLIAPILRGNELIGILILGYGSVKPTFATGELAIIRAIAKLSSLVIERERTQSERDQAHIELQVAKDELEHTSKIRNDFVAIVSHEFRTALTGIQGFSEIMRDEELSMMEMKEFAVDIHTDARRLVRMISDMLDLDRLDTGRLLLDLNWLDLNAIIIDVVGRMRHITPEHLIRLQLANALPILLGDQEKLSLVVSTLLQNSMKYSSGGGEITVSSQVEGNVVHVCVRDYGTGIPSAELERIFERYAHTGQSATLYLEGTGPGLPVVREIVQKHGGQAWAESVVGKGSMFHFTVRFTDSHS